MSALLTALAVGCAVWSAGPIGLASTVRVGLRPSRGSRAALTVVGIAFTAMAWNELRLPAAAFVGLCVAAVVVGLHQRRNRTARARTALDADVVTFCFAVAAEVRAGRMTGDAIAATSAQLGPLAAGIAAVARAARHGAPVGVELRALAVELSLPRLATVAAVTTAVTATGARLADVLERVAVAFTMEDEAVADLDALAAGPQATATVLCLLPLLGIALGSAIGAHPLTVLMHSGLGVLLLLSGAVLDGCGVLWVRTIARRALRG